MICALFDWHLSLSIVFSKVIHIVVHASVISHFSHVWLFVTPWTVAHQTPLSMGLSRPEYWSGLPFPPPGALPNPGIEPGVMSYVSCIGTGAIFSFQILLSLNAIFSIYFHFCVSHFFPGISQSIYLYCSIYFLGLLCIA